MQDGRRVGSRNAHVPVVPRQANGHGGVDRGDRNHLLRRSPRSAFDLNGEAALRLRRRRRVSGSFVGIPELSRRAPT